MSTEATIDVKVRIHQAKCRGLSGIVRFSSRRRCVEKLYETANGIFLFICYFSTNNKGILFLIVPLDSSSKICVDSILNIARISGIDLEIGEFAVFVSRHRRKRRWTIGIWLLESGVIVAPRHLVTHRVTSRRNVTIVITRSTRTNLVLRTKTLATTNLQGMTKQDHPTPATSLTHKYQTI